jgi:hypothetical protein
VGLFNDYRSAHAARPGFFRAAFAVMAVFARSAGVASCAGRCFRHARKGEGRYYGGDKRYRFHKSFRLVVRHFYLERVQRRSQRAWPSRRHNTGFEGAA